MWQKNDENFFLMAKDHPDCEKKCTEIICGRKVELPQSVYSLKQQTLPNTIKLYSVCEHNWNGEQKIMFANYRLRAQNAWDSTVWRKKLIKYILMTKNQVQMIRATKFLKTGPNRFAHCVRLSASGLTEMTVIHRKTWFLTAILHA